MITRSWKRVFSVFFSVIFVLVSLSVQASAAQSNDQNKKNNNGDGIGIILPGGGKMPSAGGSLPVSPSATATALSSMSSRVASLHSSYIVKPTSANHGGGVNRIVFTGNWKKGNMKVWLSYNILYVLRMANFSNLPLNVRLAIQGQVASIIGKKVPYKLLVATITSISKRVRKEKLTSLRHGQIFTIRNWTNVAKVTNQSRLVSK